MSDPLTLRLVLGGVTPAGVPFLRLPCSRDPRYALHTLVVTRPNGTDRSYAEWEIEHPDCCPLVCDWWPGRTGAPEGDGPFDCAPGAGRPDCYVAYEVMNAGLDSLGDQEGNAWQTFSWQPGRKGLDETLPPGRYELRGWYQSGVGAGEYGGVGDPEGGLLLGDRLGDA